MQLRFSEITSGKSIPVQQHAKIRVQAAPGEKYHLTDNATGKNPADLQVTREGNNLYLRSEEFDIEIIVEEFWEACQPGSTQCFAIIDTPEYVGGELIGQTIVTQEGIELGTLLAGEIGTISESAALGLLTAGTAAIAPATMGVVGGIAALATTATIIASSSSDSSETATPDTTAPDAPSVSIDQTGSTVSGKAEPNSTVSIKDASGKEIGTAKADADGNYTVTLTTPLTNGEKITADATDAAGNTSEPSATNAPDTTAPDKPTATVTGDGKTVSGEAEPNSTVTIKDENGDIIGTTKADANGDYTVTLTNPQQNGQTVTATATDTAGNTSSPAKEAKAPDITAPNTPTVNIDQTGSTVSGKAEPNSTVSIKDANGNEIDTATADGDGNYTVNLTTPLTNGEKITADATDTAGNTSQRSATNAPDTTAPDKPTAKVAGDGKTVSGKAEPNSTVTIKDENGDIIGTGKADANGDYTVTLTNPQQNGQKVTVTATDAAGNPSEPKNATAPDITAPDAPSIHISPDGNKISGEAEAGSTVKIDTNGDGTLDYTTTAKPDGTYSVDTSAKPLISGQKVTATATDVANNESPQSEADAPDKTPPNKPTATISDDGVTVTGKAEPNSRVTIKDATGNVLGTAKTGADGKYSVPLSTPQTNGQELKATATDAAGNASDPADVTAPDSSAPAAPTVAISQDGTKATGSAEPNSTVTLKDEAGTVIGTTTAKADGTYSIPLSPALTNGEKVTATATDKAGNISPEANATAPDTTAPDAPTIDKVNADGLSVVGKAEPNSTVTIKDATGNVLGTAKADTDGNYNVPLNTAQTNGQTLTATATDASNNESDPTTGTAPDSTAPAAPAVAISKDGTKATGEAEPNSTVTLKDEAGKVIGTTTAGADGKYEIPLSPALTNGEKVTATATDAAKNESPASNATAPDTTAPDAPNAFISDDGKTVSGTAEPNTTVTIKDKDGKPLGTAKVGEDGKYEVTLSTPQTDGQNLKATATDAAGNTSPQTDVKAPDTTPPADPTVSGSLLDNVDVVGGTPLAEGSEQPITATSNNTTNDNTPSLVIPKAVADAATAAGDIPKLVVDDKVVDAVLSKDAAGNTVLTPKEPLAEGKHTVSYLLQDAAGNQSGAAPATTFTVDTQAPAKPAKPVDYKDDVGSVQSDNSTAPTTDDTTPGINIGKVPAGETPTLYVNGVKVEATVTTNPDGTITLTPKTPLGEGKHNLSYTLTDTAGNESVPSDPIAIEVDIQAPGTASVAIPEAADGVSKAEAQDGVGVEVSLPTDAKAGDVFTLTITKPNGKKEEIKHTVTDADITAKKATVAITVPTDGTADGKYTVDTVYQDAAGNPSATQPAQQSFTLDTQAPNTASVAIPEAADGVSKAEAQDGVGVEVSLPTDAKAGDVVTLTITKPNGAKEEVKHTVTDADMAAKKATVAITVPTDGTADGKYTVDTVYQDAAGNPSATKPEQQSFDLTTTSPTQTVTNTNDGNVTAAEANDDDGVITVKAKSGTTSTVTFTANGKTVTKTITNNGSDKPVKLTTEDIAELGDGEVTVSTVTKDKAGNESSPSTVGGFTLDTTPPAAGTLNAPDNSKDNTPTITGSGAEPGANVSVEIKDKDGTLVETLTTKVGSDGRYSVTPSKTIPDGNYTATATVTDTAGNTATTTDSGSVDTMSPNKPSITENNAGDVVVKPSDTAGDDTTAIKINYTDEDGKQQTIEVAKGDDGKWAAKAGTTLPTDAAVDATTGEVKIPTHLINTRQEVTATAADAAGNTADATQVGDGTPPKVPTVEGDTAGNVTVKPSTVTGDDTTAIKVEYTDENGNPKTIEVVKGDNGTWAAKDGTTLPSITEDGITKTATVDPNTGTVTIPTELVDTSKDVTATAADSAGNTAPATLAGDITPPATPTINVVAGNDVIDANEVKKDITLTGDAEAGSKVEVKDANGNTIGTVIAGTDGKWTMPLTPAQVEAMGQEADSLTVSATDAAGNSSSSAPRAIEVDTVVPDSLTVKISTDKDGDGTITSSLTSLEYDMPHSATTIAVEVTFDQTKAKAGDTIVVKDNAGNEQTITLSEAQANAGKVTTTFPKPEEGATIKVSATYTDTAGNTVVDLSKATASAILNLLKPGMPIITIDTDANNDGYINSAENTSNTATVTVQLAVPTGSETFQKPKIGDEISIYDAGGNKIGSTVTLTQVHIDAGSKVTFTDIAISDGNKLTVKAQHKSGDDYDPGWSSSYLDDHNSASVDIATVDLTAPTQTVASTNDGKVSATEANDGVITVSSEAGSTSTVTFTGANGDTVTKTVNNDGSTAQPVKLTTAELATLGDGEVTVSTVTKDKAGNTSEPDTTGGFTLDTKAPTATITMDKAALKAGESSIVTIQFSEEVKDFVLTDLTAQNGTLTNLEQDTTDKTKYTATLKPDADTESASNTITLKDKSYTDLAGNTGTATSAAYKVDTKAPTATIAMEDTSLIAGETSKVTITFSEKVKDFNSADDVTVENGTLSAMTSNDGGKTWVGTFTPDADTENASNTIKLVNTYTDLAGNVGSTASTSYAVDTQVPTIKIASDKTALNATSTTATITFTLSEKSTDFIQEDVTVTGGVLSDWATTDNIIYTATFIPATGVTESKISVASNAFSDVAGNLNADGAEANNSVSLLVDTTPPTPSIKLTEDTAGESATDNISSNGALTINPDTTGDTTAKVSKVEYVKKDGTKVELTGNDDGTGYVLPEGEYTSITVTSIDGAGNVGTAILNNVGIDSAAPSIAADIIKYEENLLTGGITFDAGENSIGYFEGITAGTKIGTLQVTDDKDPTVNTEYNSGVWQFAWDETATAEQRSWYSIAADGTVTITEAGAKSEMNKYGTGVDTVTLKVKAIDKAGNESTRDITFKLGNTMGLAKIQDHLSDTETIHKNSGVKVTASDPNAVGFTTELADKVWVGKNEDGTPATATGLGDLGQISNWNIGEPGRLFTKGGSDFISFASMAQYAGVYAGKGNDTIAIQKSFSGIADENGPIVMTEEGNDLISIGENLSGSYILAGSGSDIINITGNVDDGSIIDLGSERPTKNDGTTTLVAYQKYLDNSWGTDTDGDLATDKNTLTINGEFTDNSRIIGGKGEDTVTIKGLLNDASLIDLGAGNDTLILEGPLGGVGLKGKATVKMGDGDDTLIYKGSQTNIDSGEITLLDGGLGANDVLDLSQATGTGYIQYDWNSNNYIKGFETIKLGSSYQGGLRISGKGLANDDVTTLKIDGTASSKVDLEGTVGTDWTKSTTATDGYYTYTHTNNESVLIHENIANTTGGVF